MNYQLKKTMFKDTSYGVAVYSNAQNLDNIKATTHGISIKYIHRGGYENFEVDGKVYHVKSGQFLLLNAHQSFVADNGHLLAEALCVDISPTLFTQKFAPILVDQSPIIARSTEIAEHIFCAAASNFGKTLYNMMFQLQQLDFERDYEHIFFHLTDCLASYIDQTHEAKSQLTVKKRSTRQELFSRLLVAQEYLHAHLHKKVTLEELSHYCLISAYHLNRLFKLVFRQTPAQYHEQIKLQKACQYLQEGKQSVTEIALDLGYADLQYFSRRFKKKFGLSPSSFK